MADELSKISGVQDIQDLDRELDQLNNLGLLTAFGGFPARGMIPVADTTPTTLALQLHARCNGHRGALQDFYTRISVSTSTDGPPT
jgi:hypothetical protein